MIGPGRGDSIRVLNLRLLVTGIVGGVDDVTGNGREPACLIERVGYAVAVRECPTRDLA